MKLLCFLQLEDVVMWLCLLLVFVCSYGVFRQALFFANKEPYWGVINDLFYKPYWHVYGELFVEQEGGSPFFPACLLFYLSGKGFCSYKIAS